MKIGLFFSQSVQKSNHQQGYRVKITVWWCFFMRTETVKSMNYVPPPKVRGGGILLLCGSHWRRRPCRRRRDRFLYPRYLSDQLMEFAWIYHWDKIKSWFGFGDLDLIFKVPGEFRFQILVPTISHEPVNGITPNLLEYIISASWRADWILATLILFSRPQEDLDDKFLYPRYLMNQSMEFHQIYLQILWCKLKSWYGFGDLDLIFNVTGGFRYMKFLKIRYLMSHCLKCHQTCPDFIGPVDEFS